MLSLIGMEPLATGGKSDVYEHPHNPDLLVKVLRPDAKEKTLRRVGFLRGRRRRYSYLLNYFRCLEEQTAVMAVDGHISPYLEKVVGYAATDRGVGLVVEKESRDCLLAPTLACLIQTGAVNIVLLGKLDEFFDWVLKSPIVINDMKPVNVVLSGRTHDAERFVLIDGYGETAAIPLKSLFPLVNYLSKRRKIERMRREVVLRMNNLTLSDARGTLPIEKQPQRDPIPAQSQAL